ncbi:SRPBCC family protein [Deminuibacter soli]|uniref:SRPBCC domain-containing protein n=1 Tax=Deminuibacter soli TaxID=2291815 RepID=A0A3E1NH21_9BACT|nr:SRPBCC domain-containing protein [Deminuibacter soli]RFM27250.1 SRPBCC domain-containing protein [Deminuibacter soli]
MNNQPFVIERTFNAPAARVWKALTDRDEMQQWYFNLSAFKPEVGFTFEFTGGKDDVIYVHVCGILEVVPERKLSYSWQYKDYEGRSVVTFELFPEGDGTRLKLTHEGLETFPQNNPDFAKTSFEQGWTYIIGKSLREYIEPVHSN